MNMRQSLPRVRHGWQSLVMPGVLLASTHCFLVITLITVSLTLCMKVGRHQETHCFLLASLSLCMREGRHQEAPFYLCHCCITIALWKRRLVLRMKAPLLKPLAGNGSGMRNVRMRKSGSSGALYTCLIHIKTDSLFHHTYALVPSASAAA